MASTTRTASALAAATPLSLFLYATTSTRATHLHLLIFLIPIIVPCVLLLFSCHSRHHESADAAGDAHRPPPSPRGLPVVGNLHQLGRLPHRSLRALAARHGPVMLLRLSRVPAVVVSSADAARDVMQAQDRAFASRPALAIPSRLLYGCTDIAFAPHGPYWRGARKMAVRHLLGPARVRAYRAVREQEVDALLRRVEHDALSGGVVRLSELLSGFAKDVAGRIVLGARAAGDGGGWRDKIDALLDESNVLLATFHVGDYVPWLSWVSAVDGTDARVRKAFEKIDGILDEIVEDAGRRMMGARPDDDAAFVHVLLSLQKESAWTELPLSMDNVKALLEDLFGAGTEATIIVLEWAMAELLRDKSAMHKLQDEVRQATCGNHGGSLVTEQDLPGMEYLRAAIKETMRLHTSGPLLLPRESMQATRIGGQYDVPTNTMVIVNAWAIGRDPETWESPEEFWPERFVGSAVDFRGQHFQLIPFGAGRRICPGIDLSMSVVELALANLVGRFDWALPEGERDLDMEEAAGCTSRKRAPLRAVATSHHGDWFITS